MIGSGPIKWGKVSGERKGTADHDGNKRFTIKQVFSEFPHPQVPGSQVPVDAACDNQVVTDDEGGNRIFRVFKDLDRNSVRRSARARIHERPDSEQREQRGAYLASQSRTAVSNPALASTLLVSFHLTTLILPV